MVVAEKSKRSLCHPLHRWRTVNHTTAHAYQECLCSARRIVRLPVQGHQPCTIDWVIEGAS